MKNVTLRLGKAYLGICPPPNVSASCYTGSYSVVGNRIKPYGHPGYLILLVHEGELEESISLGDSYIG